MLTVFVSNPSILAHICQSSVYYWDINFFLCNLYHVLWRFDIYHIVLSRQSAPNPIQSIRFSQIVLHFHPFPLHIHFHMDFHSTEGLYSLVQQFNIVCDFFNPIFFIFFPDLHLIYAGIHLDPQFPESIRPIPSAPSGIRWDQRSKHKQNRGIQWDPRSTVQAIRLDHGSNTAFIRRDILGS